MNFLEKLARMVTKQYDLKVFFEGDTARTDGQNIFLPYYEIITEELKKDLLALTHHECGHCRYTDFKEVRKNKSRAVHNLSNIMEDVRIETLMSEDYPGAAFTLRGYNEKVYNQYSKRNWKIEPMLERFFAGIFFTAIGMDKLEFMELTPKWQELVNKVAEKINTLTSTAEVMAYAKELVDLLNIPEPKVNQNLKDLFTQSIKDAIKNGKQSDSKDGKGEKRAMSKEEMEALQAALSELSEDELKQLREMAGEKTDDKKTGFKEENNPTMDSQAPATFAGHRAKEQEAIKKEKPSSIPSRGWKNDFSITNHSIPVTTRFDQIKDFTKTAKSPEFIALWQELKPFINPIREKLERTLIAPNRPHWKTNEPRGRINTRVLGLASIPTNAFKVVERNNPEAAAVVLLVDLSGSMHGEKVHVAQKAALAIAMVLELLGIPFEILGFNDHSSSNIRQFAAGVKDSSRFNRTSSIIHHHIFKSFSSNTLFGITEMEADGSNPDGECVNWAAQRLLERNEKKKILMVFSDGQPASCGDNAILCSDLKRRIKELSKSMHVIGLGIMSNAVADFYPKHVVINKLEDLPGKAVAQMVQMLVDKK